MLHEHRLFPSVPSAREHRRRWARRCEVMRRVVRVSVESDGNGRRRVSELQRVGGWRDLDVRDGFRVLIKVCRYGFMTCIILSVIGGYILAGIERLGCCVICP